MADTTHPAANDDELVDYDEENEQEEAGKVREGVCMECMGGWTIGPVADPINQPSIK